MQDSILYFLVKSPCWSLKHFDLLTNISIILLYNSLLCYPAILAQPLRNIATHHSTCLNIALYVTIHLEHQSYRILLLTLWPSHTIHSLVCDPTFWPSFIQNVVTPPAPFHPHVYRLLCTHPFIILYLSVTLNFEHHLYKTFLFNPTLLCTHPFIILYLSVTLQFEHHLYIYSTLLHVLCV